MTKAEFFSRQGNYEDQGGNTYSFYANEYDKWGVVQNENGSHPLGSEFTVREENGQLFADWNEREYLITETADGFDFIHRESSTYHFTPLSR